MRKADIISNIADKTGMAKVDILVAVEAYFKEVKEALVAGEPVYVRGFGTFGLKFREAKNGRDIKRNISVPIPAHYVPVFKPAKEFGAAVKKVPMVERAKQGL